VHVGQEAISAEGISLSFTEQGTILLESETDLTAGDYTIKFELGGNQYTVSLKITASEPSEQA